MKSKLFSILIFYFMMVIVLVPCFSSISIVKVDAITIKKFDIIDVYPGDLIQDAIDRANLGDTVYVHSGTYYENVDIHNSITLKGENKDTTVIDGSHLGNVVTTKVDDVNIQNFTIQNSRQGSWHNGIFCLNNHNINIGSCILKNNVVGIRFNSVCDSTIRDCNIYENTWASIGVNDNSSNIKIQNCTIKNNGDAPQIGGISIFGNEGLCSNITVSGCKIYDNHFYGIGLSCAENVIICDNSIYGQTDINIFVTGSAGVISNIDIHNNYVVDSSDAGIMIQDCSGDIKVEKNNITNNELSGIYLLRSQSINIKDNTISKNKFGIHLDTSPDNIIYGNNFYNNEIGIKITYCRYITESLKEENTFVDNGVDVSTKKRNQVLSRLIEHLILPDLLDNILKLIGKVIGNRF